MIEQPDEIRARLDELRRLTTWRATRFDATFSEIVEASNDVATDDEHDPEGHTIAWERQQIAALRAETNATLTQIDAALRRLDDGTYGVCIDCGTAVGRERLAALPATARCMSCAGHSNQ